MIFWEEKKSLNDKEFLISKDKTLTFKEAFFESDEIFRNCDRELVLILCDRNIETVLSYIGALRQNLVPILVDSDIKESALITVFEAYKPQYICAKKEQDLKNISSNIKEILSYDNYSLFKCDVSEKKIHKDLSLLLLTSGSTGDPKSVRLSRHNIESATINITNYLELESNHRCISLLPFHYSYGLSVLHNTIFTRASIFITQDTVFNKTLWDDCVKYEITDISTVPFTLEILQRLKLPDLFFKNLRCLTQAGGRLEPKITKYFLDLSHEKSFNYFTMYGQTEASPRISYIPPKMGKEKLGSVGIPLQCGEVYIDRIANKKGEGELIYKGPNVCLGYAENSLDLSLGDELNGILKTGDIAKIDNDNFITIVGRKKRFIKLKGISVNLDYVESLINSKFIKSLVVGKDDQLVIVIDDKIYENKKEEVKKIIVDSFNFHSSLVSIKKDELLTMSSGKPDYKRLTDKYL